MSQHYDIFISYRRDGGFESASLIAEKLKNAGYSVFFDLESLRSGLFNKALFEVIDNCKDFIIVLPENGLERCKNEDDWVRLEILRAIEHHKNIIPIMLKGFAWPENMPEGMEMLNFYQAVTATSHEYFDLSMKRLMLYLKSRQHVKSKKLLSRIAVITVAFALIVGAAYYAFWKVAEPLCVREANAMTIRIGHVDFLEQETQNVFNDWSDYYSKLFLASPNDTALLNKNFRLCLEMHKKNVDQLRKSDSLDYYLTDYQIFLLELRGIETIELDVFHKDWYQMLYDDFYNYLNMINGYTSISLGREMIQFAEAYLRYYKYMGNTTYYAYLDILSRMPESARVNYRKMIPSLSALPTDINLDQGSDYYEDLCNRDLKRSEEAMAEVDRLLSLFESQLQSLSEALEIQESIAQEMAHQDAVYAAEKQKVDAKKHVVKAQEAELAELDAKYWNVYQELKKKCTIEESDSQPYMWGKILLFVSFMESNLEDQIEMEEKGVNPTLSVTTELILADLNSMLNVYLTYNPDATTWMPSVKTFYKSVSERKRGLNGVLVFATKDNVPHKVLKPGDIIIARRNKPVVNYEDYQEIINSEGENNITFLRLEGKTLIKHTEMMPENDSVMIGFMRLHEE